MAYQAREDAAIWSRLWVCVGFAEEIPDAGDVLPFTVGHHGIHVERMSNGALAGRFNKAQHGGCRAVPLQCRTGAKTRCSFTACGYSRDRRPIRADDPGRAPALDQYFGLRPERLLPVPVETWGPLLVVRLDPREDAPRLWPDALGVLGRGWLATPGKTVWHEIACNWKQAAILLGQADAHETTVLFPNVVICRIGDHVVAAILQPVALERTLCRIRVYGRGRATTDPAGSRIAVDEFVRRTDRAAAAQGVAGRPASWFEGDIARAIGSLELSTETLFQTDGKDSW